jgi:hypothetical protein
VQRRAEGGHAWARARDIHRQIVEDGDGLLQFAWASQNITAVAALIQSLPEPTTPKEHKTQREIRELLDHVAEQQAESSLSWRRGPDSSQRASTGRDARDASIHQAPHGAGAANLPLI